MLDEECSMTSAQDKPVVDRPEGDPPADLVIRDIIEGTGAEAAAGNTVSVHYVGVAFSNGEQFDSSWDRGAPLDFQLGRGMVISGWDNGVQGMKVGGRRELVIPPDQAYGDRGAGGVIAPGETLIFVCDLVDVR
jgi:peptidylprolyl isomerase